MCSSNYIDPVYCGFGTSNPAYTVEVAGNLNILGGTLFIDGMLFGLTSNELSNLPLALSAYIDTTNANNILSGTLNPARLPLSAVAAATYGSSSTVPVVVVDRTGRVQGVTNTVISVPAANITGLAPSATTDATNAANLTSGTLSAARLPTSGVTPGVYGAVASNVPTLAIDATGRVTLATSQPIQGLPLSAVSGLTSYVANASILTTGTLAAARLPASGVAPGTYGSDQSIPVLTTDATGRILSAINTPIQVSAANVTGLAPSATTDATNATNLTSGTLSALRLPASGIAPGTYGSASSVPVLVLDGTGRATLASNLAIQVAAATQVTGLAPSALLDTTNATNITAGTLPAAQLPPSGVAPGTYGTASNLPVLTLDTAGRVTVAGTIPVAVPAAQVSGLAPSATVDATNATNLTSGTLPAARLPFTGVAAATYGSSNTIPVLTVDQTGRITAITNVSGDLSAYIIASNITGLAPSAIIDTTNATNIAFGTLPARRLPTSGVTSATYGTQSAVPTLAIDATGRITSATPTPIAISSAAVSGLAPSATTDTTNATNITSGTLPAPRLPTSGVTSGTYGTQSAVPTLAIDATGRVTSATPVPIAISSAAVSGLAPSATTDTTNATNITSGTLPAPRLPTSGVTSALYGTASTVPTLRIDATGRVTSATPTPIAIAAAAVSGLAPSATTDTTNATNLTSGTLPAPRLPTSGVTSATYGTQSAVPTLAIDATGRVTSATPTPIAIAAAAVSGLAPSATTDTTNATNLTSGTLPAPRLPTSGVISATYGTQSAVPTLAIDATGRVTSATPTPIAIATTAVSGLAPSATTDTTNATNITSGTLPALRLPTSGVTSATYGTASSVPTLRIDATGRVTAATPTPIAISSGAVSGLAPSATTDTTNATNITSGTLSATRLPTSGVTPATYGSSNLVPVLTIDATGRVTTITTVPAIGGADQKVYASNVIGLAPSGLIDTTNATNITSGTLSATRLPTSGVTPATYGSSNLVPVLTIDATGRVTTITTVPAIGSSDQTVYASNVIGLAPSATIDTTNATNLTSGTLPAARLPTSGVTSALYGTASAVPVLRVDATGRVTTVTNTSIAIAAGAVSGLAASATIDATNATNLTSGTLPATRLPTSGVTSATYGTASAVPTLAVDGTGRLTTVTNTPIAIAAGAVSGLAASATIDATNATNLSSGTLPAARLPTSGVTSALYGTASAVPVLRVDATGRVTTVTNTSIAIASGAVSGLAASATTDTTNATNITSGTLPATRLPTSGVTSATYGTSSAVPTLSVDSTGRVTTVTNTPIAIAAGAVSGLAASATTDTTNATNITSGTLLAARLPTSGVVSNTYGAAATVPVFAVDGTGRVTTVTNTPIAIAAGAVSGLAASATTDTTNASNITSGTLPAARLPSAFNRQIDNRTAKPSDQAAGTFSVGFGAWNNNSTSPWADIIHFNTWNDSSGTNQNLLALRKNAIGLRIYQATFGGTSAYSTYQDAVLADSSGNVAVTGTLTVASTSVRDAAILNTGTLSAARLPTSGVTSATYGTASAVPTLAVDATGRVTSASPTPIAIASGAVSGLAPSATTDATNATNITSGTLPATRLPTSGVTSATYGTASAVPTLAVDATGRLTTVTNTPIAIAAGAVSGLAPSATTDTTNATNITSGTLSATRLPTSGVTSGSYGTASAVPTLAIDGTGRVTAATPTPIAIAAGAVSGLAAVATSGQYADLANRPFTQNAHGFFTSCNIGVGVQVPTAPLHVGGNLRVDADLTTSNLYVLGTTTTINSVTTQASNFTIYNSNGTGPGLSVYQRTIAGNGAIAAFYDLDVSPTNPVMVIADTGLVGLGTSTPIHRLDVMGNIRYTGDLLYGTLPLVTAGTLDAARLPTSGVTSASYGSGSEVPVLTIDATGRVTQASTTPVTTSFTSLTTSNVSATIVQTGGLVATGSATVGSLSTSGTVSATTVNTDDVNVTNSVSANTLSAATLYTNTVSTGDVYASTLSATNTVSATTSVTTSNVSATIVNTGGLVATASATVGSLTTAGLVSADSVSATTIAGTTSVTTSNVSATMVNTGGLVATANATVGSLTTAGAVFADSVSADTLTATTSVTTSNVSATMVNTGGLVATANVTVGSLTTAGPVAADTVSATTSVTTSNVSATMVNTGGLVATANATVGSLTTAGPVSADSVSATTLAATTSVTTSNVTATIVNTGGLVATSGATVGSLTTAGPVAADTVSATTSVTTSNVSATIVNTGGLVATSGATVGSLTTAGPVSADSVSATTIVGTTSVTTSNVAATIVNTGGLVATSGATVGSLTTAGPVAADTVSATTSVTTSNVSATIVNTGGLVATASATVGSLTTAGPVAADTVSATTSVTTSNVSATIVNTGGLVATSGATVGSLTTAGPVAADTVSATTSVTTSNVSATIVNTGGLVATSGATVGSLTTAGPVAADTVSATISVSTSNVAATIVNTGGLVATSGATVGSLTTSGPVAADTVSANTSMSTSNLAATIVNTGGLVAIAGATVGSLTTAGAVSADTVSANTSMSTSNVVATIVNTGGLLATAGATVGSLTTAGAVSADRVSADIISGTTSVTTSNVAATIVNTGGLVATAGATVGSLTTAGPIVADTLSATTSLTTSNVAATIVNTGGLVATASATVGSLSTTGPVTANSVSADTVAATTSVTTSNVAATIVNTGGLVATAGATVGSLTTAGPVLADTISATTSVTTSNVVATIVNTGGLVATAGATVGSLTTTGPVAANTVSATTSVTTSNVAATIVNTGGLVATASATVGSLSTTGPVAANSVSADTIAATTSVTTSNVAATIVNTGGLVATAGATVGSLTTTGPVAAGSLTTSGVITAANVGIGSTQPANRLDVAGSMSYTANVLYGSTPVFSGATLSAASLPVSGVTSASYGSASVVPVLAVDATGRLTTVTDTPIAITASAVSGLAAVATSGQYADLANRPFTQNAHGFFTSCNIGIGVQVPTAPLHVGGNLRVDADLTTSNLYVLGTTTTINSVTTQASNFIIYNSNGAGPGLRVYQRTLAGNGAIAAFYDLDVSPTNPVMVIADTGLVGIGTSTPVNRLDVVGNVSYTGDLLYGTLPLVTAGTLNAARLPTSGVTSATYGTASAVPTLAVDATGRLTAVTNTPIVIASGAVSGLAPSATTDTTNATNITSGTLPAARLPTSGVTSASYGSASVVPVLAVDGTGRVTTVTDTPIAIASGAVSGLAPSATTDTTNATNITSGTLPAARLPTSGVTSSSYGSASVVPVLAVDGTGRVTTVTDTPIAIASGAVSGLAPSATTDTTNATNITSGTLSAGRLPTSGVTSSSYGSASVVPVLAVDATGRLTTVTDTPIAIASGAVSGLAPSATTDTTNATNITSGTLSAGRLPTSGVTSSSYGSASVVPVLAVDATGRLTTVTDTPIAITSSAVSGLAPSATTDTTNATNITSGTLSAGRLPTSGVTSASYGSASVVPVLAVDGTGRVTTVTDTPIAIASGAVSGLAPSATTDTTNATNITSGTLSAGRLPTSGVTSSSYGSASVVPVLAVDATGRLTTVTDTPIAIASGAVSGLAPSATTDTTNATNITSGTLSAGRLPTSGVTSSSYGSASVVPVLAVDATGRLTTVTDTPIAIASGAVSGLAPSATTDTTNATNITSGTLSASRLPTSGVASASYGSASVVPVFAVDGTGRVTTVTDTPIAIASSAVSGLAPSATTDTTNATNITSGTLSASRLPTSGVASASYGSASVVPVFAVDGTGRVTTVTDTPIAIASGAVSGLAPSATTDTTNATNITSGTLSASRLPTSGVASASYGSASVVPVFAVDGTGRVTTVTDTPIAITSSAVSGLAPSATTDTTNATNITSGTLSASRLPTSGVASASYGSASVVPVFAVDGTGRVTTVTDTPIAIASSAVSGLAPSATTDTTNATNITSGTLSASRFPTSGVASASYGSASVVPVFAVDGTGRVTTVTDTPIAIAAGAVSGLAAVATSGQYADLANRPFTQNAYGFFTSCNIGIGIAVPTAPLHVSGNVRVDADLTTSNLYVLGTTTTINSVTTQASNFTIYNSNGTGPGLSVYQRTIAGNGAIAAFYDLDVSPTNPVMIIADTGLVGIGTTTPVNPLDVVGNISYTGDLLYGAVPVVTAGTLNAARLPASGVTSGSYGAAASVPVFSVDGTGRITTVTNTAIAIASGAVSGLAASATTDTTNATNITAGTLPAARLPTSGVVSASYGAAASVPVFSVDGTGRITTVTNTAIAIASGAVSGLAASATTDTTNATNITTGTLAAARLPTSGVVSASYGAAASVPVFSVDGTGRITTVTNTAIAIASGAVSGLAASATTNTTNATNITSGTLPAARLPTSGVVSASYGTAASVPVFSVDGTGRVTTVTNTAIAIASGAVSGLAPSATTDTTNATNITTGTLPAARLPTSGVVSASYGSDNQIPIFAIDETGRITSASTAVIGIRSQWVSSGTSIYLLNSNVGIGTTAPLQALHVSGNVVVGSNTSYLSYQTVSTIPGTGSNLILPAGSGTINGVNLTVLNRRARASYASANNAVSTWTTRTPARDTNWYSVCWSPELGLFCSIAYNPGSTSSVMTSPDGINWTSRTAIQANWTSVCWSPQLSIFCAVAYTNNTSCVMTSGDGITWTQRTGIADWWWNVCWSPELMLFCAVAYTSGGVGTGGIMTSPNGITWTSRTPAFGANIGWYSVCWAPEANLFCAVAITGNVATSPDGINWTEQTPAAVLQWASVCWSPELSLFCASGISGTNRIMTSPDGIRWTSRTVPVSSTWQAICWSQELSIFCAVANSGNRVIISADGINWVVRTAGANNFWRSICWSPELSMFCVVGSTGTGNRVMTSGIGLPAPKSTLLANPSYMTINQSNGNVGIGSTQPATQLDVAGSISASNLTAGNINFTGSLLQNGAPYIGSQWTTSNLGAGSNQTIYITGSNVGIGTLLPQFPLDVLGTVRATAFQGDASGLCNLAGQLMYITGGGLRVVNQRLVVDGDLILGGRLIGGCNTQTFNGGALLPSVISQNTVTSSNLVDRSVTFSKLDPSAYNFQWLQVTAPGGGLRTTQRVIIDGDLVIGGNLISQSNTSVYTSLGILAGPIAPAVVATSNIIDDAVTIPKIDFSSNLPVFFGGSVGIGTEFPRQRLHVVGNVFATGDVTAASDSNLKTALAPLTGALDKVAALTGYTYTRRDDPTQKRLVGLLAQEVQRVLPEAVYASEGPEGLSLAYGNLVALLVEAVKELRAENDALRAWNRCIEDRLRKLEEK